ncbi:guanine nucleotide exchange protein for ADP-robosylation factor [Ascosphaera acerosa]|nr:guanine nucleotide exchange protein for ADP-robosylation factor [Ascosphaera acerosa]
MADITSPSNDVPQRVAEEHHDAAASAASSQSPSSLKGTDMSATLSTTSAGPEVKEGEEEDEDEDEDEDEGHEADAAPPPHSTATGVKSTVLSGLGITFEDIDLPDAATTTTGQPDAPGLSEEDTHDGDDDSAGTEEVTRPVAQASTADPTPATLLQSPEADPPPPPPPLDIPSVAVAADVEESPAAVSVSTDPQPAPLLERQRTRQSSVASSTAASAISTTRQPASQNQSQSQPQPQPQPRSSPAHARSHSRSTVSNPLTSAVFIVTALDTIAESRDCRRSPELQQAVEDARSNIRDASETTPIDPEVIFRPLHLATKTSNVAVQVAALDCIGTLITYSYFAFPSVSLAEDQERERNRQQQQQQQQEQQQEQEQEQEQGQTQQAAEIGSPSVAERDPPKPHDASSPASQAQATAQDRQSESQESLPLIERAIETICDCFENETTPPEIQQQIIKSLLAAVLNDRIVVHGAGLLKAVRQIYNIFIYSRDSQNQQIAQGSLTQMVGTVLDRVKGRIDLKEAKMKEQEAHADADLRNEMETGPGHDNDGRKDELDASSQMSTAASDTMTESHQPVEKLTLQSFETSQTPDAGISDNTPTMVTRTRTQRSRSLLMSTHLRPSLPRSGASSATTGSAADEQRALDDELDEIYVKDAFLVVRAMCKLSHKVLSHDQQQDLRSQNMRTKLLSLHLLQQLLTQYISVFMSPLAIIRSGVERRSPQATGPAGKSSTDEGITLLQAIKPHLCLSLSRNGASAVPRVYEVCCEIFWLMLKHMRVLLKKEVEVFLKEVYIAILDKRTSPIFQKQGFMDILGRLALDPRALVEIYLNYDCDRTALENMFQSLIEHLSKLSSMPVAVTPAQEAAYEEEHAKRLTAGPGGTAVGSLLTRKTCLPPSLTTARMPGSAAAAQLSSPTITLNNVPVPAEYVLKQRALECLTDILKSLDAWAAMDRQSEKGPSPSEKSRASYEFPRDSLDTSSLPVISSPRLEPASRTSMSVDSLGIATPQVEDDPNEIEKVKQRKIALSNAIRTFNFKPKRGLKLLLREGFIRSESPSDIALFLLRTDQLDKAALGEFLGEGDPEYIAIMHAFVDHMNFAKRPFVDALRYFLQSFRLPGESQKIDRFMLKFAERYLTNNPGSFKSADAPYVLAYSVILLNTDLHSVKFKGRRMSKEDFLSNNRGINDNSDLPPEYLGAIYDDIQQNEIVLQTERDAAANLGIAINPPPTLASRAGQALASVGRDTVMEQYSQASEEISHKTEQLYRSLIRAQRRFPIKDSPFSKFIPATSGRHVGSMLNVTWMSFLSGLSAPIQETQSKGTITLAMQGLRLAVHISCIFDLETPREAFVSALSKFTNLNNFREMVEKNVEALKILLEVAIVEGNYLKSSWREILTCISQLDRFQLLTEGIDEGAIPDPSLARSTSDLKARKSVHKTRTKTTNGITFRTDVALESRSATMIKLVDRIFTNTANLSSEAIVDFVRALSLVSWQEIQSSGNSESPRTYSLQKVVEISYYNMTRVRIEWARIWEVLGQHFNQVGCHTNTHVVFFALDSLRQLSMRFMEIGELPGFRFQKDFLKPFEHVIANTNAVSVKDMVLRCLSQMIQARGDNIRSGWKTMFGVFTVAAREPYEAVVNMAFEHVASIYKTRFSTIITQGAFTDLVVCLTEFSKNLKFQKRSLQAIETLKATAPKLLKTPECPLYKPKDGDLSQPEAKRSSLTVQGGQSPEEQFWYPLLVAFQDVLMTGDDLEVRSRALSYLFEILITHGGDFPQMFWDVLWRQLLYPIFVVLQSKSEMSKVPNHEELSVWLSTTMIQALRNMISLFTHYFEALKYMLDRFLELLTLCICQENDTIARIGSNCLQQLILESVAKFDAEDWHKIVGAFVELFEKTTAYDLFTAVSAGPEERRASASTIASAQPELADRDRAAKGNGTSRPTESEPEQASRSRNQDNPDTVSGPQPPSQMTVARRQVFNRIITNCVLQLLMIETVNELFSNASVFELIPSNELLRLMALLKKSYQFAKRFNEAKELRIRLWRQGFMKQPPNLLKQESGSAATYVTILFRMYEDENEERKASRAETEAALVPLCADILRGFISLDDETQQRNIAAWRPVVVDVLEGFTGLPTETFEKHIETFYPLAVGLLGRDFPAEIRIALFGILKRTGVLRLSMPEELPFRDPTNDNSPYSRRRRSDRAP